jgi:amino acid adenylation domain-containing protein
VWSRHRLHSIAEAIAVRLPEHGLGRGDLVTILLPKSPAYAAAMLGVVRAGAAYLPLDHTQPPQRLSDILDDARPRAVICTSETASLPPATAGLPRIALDTLPETGPESAERPRPRPDDLLYVVYTSGSTGRPKGVEVSYGNLAAMLAGYQQQSPVTAEDRLAWYVSAGFDFSQAEVWPALIHGASVHVVPERVRLDPESLLHWLAENRVTIVCLPTPVAEMMLPLPWPETIALRWMCVGGEKLNLRPRLGLPFEVINVYGPTETTVFCTWGPTVPDGPEAPPLGRPLPGTLLEVRDGAGRLVPQGVVGELHIGGTRVAQGYRGSPELTAQKFRTDEDGVRWYASGDQVRWRSDGLLEYRGRTDDQIQIRGVRVEPAEVTQAVLSLPGVREAMVYGSTDPDTGLSALTCCVCPEQPVADDAAAFRNWRSRLANLLPRPMIPEHWSIGDRLPLASLSGKRDLAAVRARQHSLADIPATADGSDTVAATVRKVWQDVLATKDIPDDASFFDLGGHSLLVIKALGRIEHALGAKLSLTDFFEDPTIAGTVRMLSTRPRELSGQARRRGQL